MVDYSKWKDIEISDDEDETHPNIDTPSLFRWRHQARVERMEEQKKEKEEFEKLKQVNEKKLKETKKKLLETEKQDDLGVLKKTLEDLELEASKIKSKEEELQKKEKTTPWNVDTISKSGFTKTVINPNALCNNEENLTDEEREQRMKQFVKDNEKKLKEFGMLRRYDDSKRFLTENQQLVSENTANYLVIWCINLEMEEKRELMGHVAHQCICMQYILELSKQLEVDPRACVGSFFTRIQVADAEYRTSFDEELRAFRERIEKRAAEKVAEALAEAEEKEREERLGPGGLDPVEVFESLPDVLKQCFESQNIPLLQETIATMPEEDAIYHMKRCVDSGLWVPEGGKKAAAGDPGTEPEGQSKTQED